MPGGHERVIAALERREPDRVPVMDMMIEFANIYEILGRRTFPLQPVFENPYAAKAIDLLASTRLGQKAANFSMDVFTYDRTAASVRMGYDCAWVAHGPVYKTGNSREIMDIFGRQFRVGFDGKGNLGTPMYTSGAIASPADWKALDKSDIFGLPARNHKAFARVQKKFGNDLFILGAMGGGLFEIAWQCMGFERFAVCARREKDFLARMISFYTDLYCLIIEAQADAGLPATLYSDDLAYRSGPMLSPRQLDELFGESYRALTDTAHRLGMKIVIHSCGNVYPLLDWFADCGFDGVHALEPTAGVELKKAKEMVGDRICLIGNVDVTHILVDATREEVFEAVRQSIADAGAGGGYIVAPTNSHPGMSVRNLRWMIEAVHQYGVYA